MRPRDGQRQGRGEQRVVRGRWINYTAHLQHVNKMVMEDEYIVLVVLQQRSFLSLKGDLHTYHIQSTWPKEGRRPAKVPTIFNSQSPQSQADNNQQALGTSTKLITTQRNLWDLSRRGFQEEEKKKETNARNSARVGGTHEESPVKEKAH